MEADSLRVTNVHLWAVVARWWVSQNERVFAFDGEKIIDLGVNRHRYVLQQI